MIEQDGPTFDINKDPRNTGPETRARYRYQDECLALRCIADLASDNIDLFVTEWATDYVVRTRDGGHELVSVKHRDPHQGDWTLSRLKQSRVFTDLFRHWRANGKSSYCTFESNAGRNCSGPLSPCRVRFDRGMAAGVAVLYGSWASGLDRLLSWRPRSLPPIPIWKPPSRSRPR